MGGRRTTLFARDGVECQRSQLRNGRVFLSDDYSHSRSTKFDVCNVRGTKRVKVAFLGGFCVITVNWGRKFRGYIRTWRRGGLRGIENYDAC